MAEDKQNDLSMEDILSSIKDILSNDTQDDSALRPVLAEQNVDGDVVAEEDNVEDDVFDLSADMMIDDAAFANLTQEAEMLDLGEVDSEKENIPEVAAEPVLETDIENLSDILNLSEVADDAVPEITNNILTPKEDIPYTEDIIETVSEVIPEPEEENFDILPEPEIPSQEDLIEKGVEVEIKSEPEENNIISDVDAEPIFSVDEERAPLEADVSEIEELMDNQAVLNQEKEVKIEENQEEIHSDEIEGVLSAASELIEADVTEDTSAVDASANIISNFAKMFAAKSDKKSEEKESSAPVVAVAPMVADEGLGDVSKTLEDIIKDTIKQMIGAAVMEKFSENTDINKYAQEEIRVQTKAWLDKNLPIVVEAAVQKEIERVMAKVGS